MSAAMHALHVVCAPGFYPWVEMEIKALGMSVQPAGHAGALVEGTLDDAMRLIAGVRTASQVLLPIASFPCDSPDDLYEGVRTIAWEELIRVDRQLTVTGNVEHPTIRNTMFANVRVKDAIVDRLGEVLGQRPDSGPDRLGAVIDVFWKGPEAKIFLNLSGQRLSDRGYRREGHEAPMRESLAAAVILALGWTGEAPLVNPMCGSGTLAIEAALIGLRRAPGLLRGTYGFMHTRLYDEARWRAVREEAKQSARRDLPSRIVASDIDPGAVEVARRNARTAGVEQYIDFSACDFARTSLPAAPGQIVVNPGYGLRVGDIDALAPLYRRLGDWFKQSAPGWRAAIFTGNHELAKVVGLHASRRIPFRHAELDCRLLTYDIYAGSKRQARA